MRRPAAIHLAMEMICHKLTILRLMGELDRHDPRRWVFGAGVRRYKRNPPSPRDVLDAFGGRHGIRLPDDYRSVLADIGDGGAGPLLRPLPPRRAG